MVQFLYMTMGMLTLKANEVVQQSSKVTLEYYVIASSLETIIIPNTNSMSRKHRKGC